MVTGSVAGGPASTTHVWRTAARTTVIVAVLIAVYAVLPVRSGVGTVAAVVVSALAGLVVFTVSFLRHLRRIESSPSPSATAVEAFATITTVFVLCFSLLYLALAANDPGAFSEPMSKIGAGYFVVTVLTTVGFGDIHATSDLARLLVTIQMILDLALLAAALRAIITTARKVSQQRRTPATGQEES